MILLGIDPGSRLTGFGVIDVSSVTPRYVASGCIRINATTLAQKLAQVYAGVAEVIAQHAPGEMAIEQVFMSKNADSALKLGQARGTAIVCAANHGLDVHEYAARRIKQVVTGNGGADKTQVQHMVQSTLRLSGLPQADAADALAIALTHFFTCRGALAIPTPARSTRQRSSSWRDYRP
ncbi:crossover junction endodeoxyribonuclease RuvC [Kushneria pakistanensis]|uniref:Crossover junction endodeoxyribonuclease RuvC n=1 Tax=Kushneria pakistanensis TaxID=1508770 RepID=A0ABQ3FEC3_9GAMM|nr:crossover junction endodeoxyribonuclease RuvC [Kushneria pakistanensis]GHC20306.1 crossover junction endodeoxyribonuclease RuvC [Kushneria pakistanensis]